MVAQPIVRRFLGACPALLCRASDLFKPSSPGFGSGRTVEGKATERVGRRIHSIEPLATLSTTCIYLDTIDRSSRSLPPSPFAFVFLVLHREQEQRRRCYRSDVGNPRDPCMMTHAPPRSLLPSPLAGGEEESPSRRRAAGHVFYIRVTWTGGRRGAGERNGVECFTGGREEAST